MMTIETKEIKEYHENGQLAYTDTHAYLDASTVNKFNKTVLRISHDNKYFVRIGINAKYDKNGEIVWLFERDEKSNVIRYINRITQ